MDLYARWSKTNVYVPVEELSGADAANGTYVIVSSMSAETQYLGRQGANIGSGSISVQSDTLYDTNMQEYGAFITGAPDAAQWIVEYYTTKDGYDLYTFANDPDVNYCYLRNKTNGLEFANTLLYNGNRNDKHMWTYGIKYAYCLQSEFQAISTENDQTVYYNGDSWLTKKNNPQKTVYLFKLEPVVYYWD